MNTLVKFIDTDYIKRFTTIEENVDDSKIVPFIYKAQDLHLQQAIGTTFYNHLKDGVINSTLTVDEEALIRNFIQPMVCEWTLYMVMPYLHNKTTNKAVVNQNSEWSTSVDNNTIKYLRQDIRDLAEMYTKNLLSELCQYPQKYPIYYNGGIENVTPNNTSYFSGVFIPKKNRYNRSDEQYRK